jgi:hypothetical protein
MLDRNFQTFFGRISAILNGAGWKDYMNSGVCAESAMTLTFLSNVTCIKQHVIINCYLDASQDYQQF